MEIDTKNMVVAIVNYQCNEEVKELRSGFSPYAEVFAVDSGSDLKEPQKKYFDLILPNVYYSGLMNAVYNEFKDKDDDFIIYWVCSDVSFSDYKYAIEKVEEAFKDPEIGVYAPSANDSPHKHMIQRNRNDLRQVTFVEGFCFATKLGHMREMCPIDTDINRIGWGLDVYLGYDTVSAGRKSVVDYGVRVFHPTSSGYQSKEARKQRDRWFRLKSKKAQKFWKWATIGFFNTWVGIRIVKKVFG